MVKILTLTDSLGEQAGGLSHGTLNLALSASCKWSDAEFIIVAQQDKSPIFSSILLPSNLKIEIVRCFRNQIFPWSHGLFECINQINPDLIHLRGLWRQPSIVCMQWKKRNPKKPLIVQTAGMLEPWARSRNKLLKSFYYNIFEKDLINSCDLIHATSSHEVKTLCSLGIDSDKISLIQEGIFMPDKTLLQLPNNSEPRKLLFLSRLHPVKGIEMLLEALSLIRPRRWVCQIAGMGEPSYVQHLADLTSSLCLDDFVTFLGPLSGEAKQSALAHADAFILPSFSESFGIAIAEAMSWGLPVLTTTATPWQVLADQNMGWLVEPTINALAEGLFDMFQTSPEVISVKGMKSRKYIADNYDWSVVSGKMIDAYRILLDAGSD